MKKTFAVDSEISFQAMKQAMELAERGRGFVSPNPLVGVLLVRNGKIIAQDWHRHFGEGHAEWNLLTKFKGTIRPTDVLVVTLEPCCHKDKKTPPCTDIIMKRGVKQVVVGIKDPNPEVNGKGIQFLKRAGVNVEVICPLLSSRPSGEGSGDGRVERSRILYQNRFYFTWITKHRPWVTLKMAQTLDGRITPKTGEQLWLTGKKARAHASAMRAQYDAILVGANTVLVDNPQLSARDARGALLPHQPRTVILDARLSVPMTSHAIRPGTIIFTEKASLVKRSHLHQLGEQGAEVIPVQVDQKGFLNLKEVLRKLAEQGVASLLVEGGSTVWSSFLREGLADELMLYLAPKLVGDGISTFRILGFSARKLRRREMKVFGDDIFWNGIL